MLMMMMLVLMMLMMMMLMLVMTGCECVTQNQAGKYMLELELVNKLATTVDVVARLTERLRASPQLSGLFARWRSERRTAAEDGINEDGSGSEGGDEGARRDLRSDLLKPLAPQRRSADPGDNRGRQQEMRRHLLAFFMGLDPQQDARQTLLIGEQPEVRHTIPPRPSLLVHPSIHPSIHPCSHPHLFIVQHRPTSSYIVHTHILHRPCAGGGRVCVCVCVCVWCVCVWCVCVVCMRVRATDAPRGGERRPNGRGR